MGVVVKGDNKCVASAVSIVRGMLGYKTSLPKCLRGDYSTKVEWISRNAHLFFPKHSVSVFCDPKFSDSIGFAGSATGMIKKYQSITLFEYHKAGEDVGHMVIGDPFIPEGVETSLCISVKCRVKKV